MLIRGKIYKNYRYWVVEEWNKRRDKNPNFSLRAFAKYVGISPSTLSAVLSGKRNFSKFNIYKLSSRFSLSNEELNALLKSNFESKFDLEIDEGVVPVSEDNFKLISDWYYYAILSLAAIKNCSSSPKIISEKLSIPIEEAESAIDRLIHLGLVESKYGQLIATNKPMVSFTGNGVSIALRHLHRQNLKKAERSLDQDPVTIRDFSSITVPANPDQIHEVRKAIVEFRRKMKRLLEVGSCKDVYTLAIQLFPVTRGSIK